MKNCCLLVLKVSFWIYTIIIFQWWLLYICLQKSVLNHSRQLMACKVLPSSGENQINIRLWVLTHFLFSNPAPYPTIISNLSRNNPPLPQGGAGPSQPHKGMIWGENTGSWMYQCNNERLYPRVWKGLTERVGVMLSLIPLWAICRIREGISVPSFTCFPLTLTNHP